MKNIIHFSMNNPLLVNFSLLILIIAGWFAWHNLPQEIFPVVDLDMASISTEFEGASPIEVEQQVTLSIEEEFKNNQDIDYISSISKEGWSNIYIKLKPTADVDDFMRDSRTIIDRIDDLPDTTKKPELNRIRTRFPVITATLYGDLLPTALYEEAQRVQQHIQKMDGVASVGLVGDREWEIWVEVNPHTIAAFDLSINDIDLALRQNLIDQPGGSIKSIEGDIRLRGLGVIPHPNNIKDIVLRTDEQDGELTVGQVAKVSRRYEEPDTYARFKGAPSVNLTITKTSPASTIEVSSQVKAYIQTLAKELPNGMSVDYHTDMSSYVKHRLNLVKSSGLIGLMLVLLSLYMLLNFKIAIITALGIPVSFVVAVILLFCFGYTINMVSLFAFLIVLGMIVDDAIIVTENIYRHVENGLSPRHASVVGAKEVFWPVVVSTLTTIAAFIPMFAIGGTLGAFITVIPIVVCCALVGSLLEAFLVLPAHTSYFLVAQPKKINTFWEVFFERYGKLLAWVIGHRYSCALGIICMLLISLVYAQTRLPYQLFGEVETSEFFINIETPNTYSLEDSLEVAKQLEVKLNDIMAEDVNTILTNVGVSVIDFNRNKTGSNVIQFVVDLKKPLASGFIERWISPLMSFNFSNTGERERHIDEIIEQIRKEIMKVPSVTRMSILKPNAGPAGDDIDIGIISNDLAVLQQKANEISHYLQRVRGVSDVEDDQESGKLELRYQLNALGKRLGLSQAEIANVVRGGYLGIESAHVTWQDKRIPVKLIYDEKTRQTPNSLIELPIVVNFGEMVYLGDVADVAVDYGSNQVRRRDNQRMARITADVDANIITPNEVVAQVVKKFGNDDSYQFLFLGEKKEAEESFSGIKQALIIALLLIFFMLTALFKTLKAPIVIMFSIPFGIIGVIIGHALFSYNLQFLSMIGMLALSGIIINDSLILVDFICRLRQDKDRITAVIEASRVRSRPIILTTVTTFLGVSPLIFFATGQTAFLSPMAVSLGFGLIFATVLILLAIPCFYLIADDIHLWFNRKILSMVKP